MVTQPDEQLSRQLASMRRLVEASLVLSSMLELRPILEYILDTAIELTDAEAASVMLMDPNTHELFFEASTTVAIAELQKIPVPLDGSIAGAIVREDRPIVLDDIREDPRHFATVGQKVNFEVRSLLGVPMRYKDRVIGVVEALNKIEGRWAEADRNHLLILASQAAVAVENAQLVKDLQKAYDEVRQLDKLKNDFIAIASHELRTPLGVILGYASFLKEDAQGEMSSHAEAVLNSALHLRTLIEDMTSLRNLQVGRGELQLSRVNLAYILESVYVDMRSLTKVKGQSLSLHLPETDILLEGDPNRLGMALTSVLNNAIKFTPNGGVIDIWTELHGGEVWVRVADNGPGIPEDALERIFQQFYQVEDHMTRRHGGMGLGLSIAKAVIEAHNGRIWAESEGTGKGSRFTMALPVM
ncbi:MAG: GAF domain-containing protein [Anaerolineae bacterium]|nr:GAF domain-containing protein [Anaerolineae bacterium]